MDAVFKKLNYKEPKEVFVLNAPQSFDSHVQSIMAKSKIKTKVSKSDQIEFAIGFAIKQLDVNEIVNSVAPQLKGDAIFWICYPKGTSKKYKCDFNRDTGWEILGSFQLEGVRQVAIDEDWSALRFRKIEFIKNFTRREKMALSAEGKQRTQSNP